MPEYDFKSLSPPEFEVLVRDLLQCQEGEPFESFAAGRDRGIDLRHFASASRVTIGQCKHYAGSDFRTLYRDLRNTECRKIRSLQPSRYILATSLALTPGQKDKLLALLAPYCVSPADVLGQGDLNGLLALHPEVESRHFKLWLSSTAVLARVFATRVYSSSALEQERIRSRIRRYVQNSSFTDALGMLDKHHYCIVCGIPGIGKTTLAEMLFISLIDRGFEPIKIGGDLAESVTAFDPRRRQVFYYDDFLGRASLEATFQKNEDEELVRFIHRVETSPRHRFLLTTREYILNQAKRRYERLAQSNFDLRRCTVSLASYTRLHRAEILFNHLYFSAVPPDHINGILSERNYLRLIDHRNFNPRIVEWMTDFLDTGSTPASDYFAQFAANLDDPARLWRHAFENQLSQPARRLLLVVASFPGDVEMEDARAAYESLSRCEIDRHNTGTAVGEFDVGLKELLGNFVWSERYTGHAWHPFGEPPEPARYFLGLHNPSIRDFIRPLLQRDQELLGLMLASAVFFEQCEELLSIRAELPIATDTIEKVRSNAGAASGAVQRTFLASPADWNGSLRERTRHRVVLDLDLRLGKLIRWAGWASSPVIDSAVLALLDQRVVAWGADPEWPLSSIWRVLASAFDTQLVGRAEFESVRESLSCHMLSGLQAFEDYESFYEFQEYCPARVSMETETEVASRVAEFAASAMSDFCETANDPGEIRAHLKELETLAARAGVSISHAQGVAGEAIDAIENRDYDDPDEGYFSRAEASAETVDDGFIDDLFASLAERR